MDHRSPLVIFGNRGQDPQVSGFEILRAEYELLSEMQLRLNGLQSITGVVRVSSLLLAFQGHQGCIRYGPMRGYRGLLAFLIVLGQRSSVHRSFPTLWGRLPELLLNKTFRGVPIGYCASSDLSKDARINAHGWEPRLFDRVHKRGALWSKTDRRDDARHLMQALHVDLLHVLERVCTMIKRDRQLFKSRVMFFDSPLPGWMRFTPKPVQATGRGGKFVAAAAEAQAPAEAESSEGSEDEENDEHVARDC